MKLCPRCHSALEYLEDKASWWLICVEEDCSFELEIIPGGKND